MKNEVHECETISGSLITIYSDRESTISPLSDREFYLRRMEETWAKQENEVPMNNARMLQSKNKLRQESLNGENKKREL